jgi:hypothetical protein
VAVTAVMLVSRYSIVRNTGTIPVLMHTVEPGFYITEGTLSNEYEIKEIKIYITIEIKPTKLILCYIKDVILFIALN